MQLIKFLILSLTLIFFITACSTKKEVVLQKEIKQIEEPKNKMEKVSFMEIEGFFEDDLNYALEVFKKDCKRSKRYELFKDVCLKEENEKDGRIFFITNFQPHKLIDSKSSDEGIITGYYEPLLYGSLTKTKKYKYPIYKIPKDLIL